LGKQQGIDQFGWFTVKTWAKKPQPKPSKKQQDLIDRMAVLFKHSGNAGIEKRGRYWEVWYRGTTACEMRTLAEAAWAVKGFEEQAQEEA
jgi:hypothetical protein